MSGRNSSMEGLHSTTDMVNTLASKVLDTPWYTTMVWSSRGIQLANGFHLVGRILEEKASLSSSTVAQATANFHATEDPKEAAKWD